MKRYYQIRQTKRNQTGRLPLFYWEEADRYPSDPEWTYQGSASVYTEEEKAEVDLPEGGEWVEVPGWQPDATSQERWEDNNIQFMRLLGEIACLDIPNELMDDLCEAMDLELDELEELFKRAQAAWDVYKATIP